MKIKTKLKKEKNKPIAKTKIKKEIKNYLKTR